MAVNTLWNIRVSRTHRESSTSSSKDTCRVIMYTGCAPEFCLLQVSVSSGELLGMNQAGLEII